MSEPYRELLIGCGTQRRKWMGRHEHGAEPQWHDLTTLDIRTDVEADIIANIDNPRGWIVESVRDSGDHAIDQSNGTIKSNYFDEVHAYEVLEYLGRQGDAHSFFATFEEIYRILKPGGLLIGTSSSRYSAWAWGDPGHRRVILQESLTFLDRKQVHKNKVKGSRMNDYSHLWTGDLEYYAGEDNHVLHTFGLRAHKPVRIFP